MISEFEKLRDDEREVLYKAPILVSILIAGADGKIDRSEQRKAIDVVRSRQSRVGEQLLKYYKVVGENFEEKFIQHLAELPAGIEQRNKAITLELRKLNFIFAKIDKNYAYKLRASLKDLAKKIAESSGGVLGYLSISYEESKLLELNMIKEIN